METSNVEHPTSKKAPNAKEFLKAFFEDEGDDPSLLRFDATSENDFMPCIGLKRFAFGTLWPAFAGGLGGHLVLHNLE